MAVYLNKETGEVTKTRPTKARVLVADGLEIPESVQALLDGKVEVSAESNSEAEPDDDADPEPEPEDDGKTVTSKATRRRG